MVINYLEIINGFENKTFNFKNGFNEIYSLENSKGKTTLLRILLHSMGYQVPATVGFKTFDKIITKLSITNNKKKFIIERCGPNVQLNIGEQQLNYILPLQENELHAMIYGINDALILDNILATFYIDQDKGWALLNRGKIVGNNRFNIEDFITGLSEKDVSQITLEIEKVEAELKKYRFLLETAEYKKELEHNDTLFETSADKNKKLQKNRTLLIHQKREVEKNIKDVEKISKTNSEIIYWIEKMKISVVDDNGNIITLNRKNILNYDANKEYLDAKRRSLSLELTKINNQINKIEKELADNNTLLDIKSIADEMDQTIQNMNIDYYKINSIVNDLSKKRSDLKKKLDDIFANSNNFLEEIFEDVKKYTSIFGIADRIPNDVKFILTRQLKGFSGKVLNQLTFSFKLAYIKQIKKKYNVILPIIIDSLKSGELTDLAANNMLDVLQKDFSEHQIIIASVYKYDVCKNFITIKNYLMEQ